MVIKKFGERAVAALVNEFKQLDTGAVPGKPVICAINPKELTDIKKKSVKYYNAYKGKTRWEIEGKSLCGRQATKEIHIRQE